jgi:hypothetical protein
MVGEANGRNNAHSASAAENQITIFRWRKEYGGMRVDQARRLKELEQENARLN